MTDAMEAFRQSVEQEAADELSGGERHHLLTIGAITAIVFVAKGNAGLIEAD